MYCESWGFKLEDTSWGKWLYKHNIFKHYENILLFKEALLTIFLFHDVLEGEGRLFRWFLVLEITDYEWNSNKIIMEFVAGLTQTYGGVDYVLVIFNRLTQPTNLLLVQFSFSAKW